MTLPLGGDPWLLFDAWKNGILPRRGAWDDQPEIYCQCVRIMRQLAADAESRQVREMREKTRQIEATPPGGGGMKVVKL